MPLGTCRNAGIFGVAGESTYDRLYYYNCISLLRRKPLIGSYLLSAFVLLGTFPSNAKDSPNWPGFRGTYATGIAEGYPTPTTWNVEKKENLLWKTAIPGLGHSSPIVW